MYERTGALSMRMYPNGMKSLIRGWSKSFASGAGKTEAIYLFLVSLWLTSMINYILFYLLYGINMQAWQLAAMFAM
ncbi:hypothetical protein AAAC51_22165 [Priestia megaterium]